MKLLQIAGSDPQSVLIFGLGLIGGAVNRALQQWCQGNVREFAYDWQDEAERHLQRSAIQAALPQSGRLTIAWTGGQSGFASSPEEMGRESQIVTELIDMARALSDQGRCVDFHLLSSAGGLFEGQTHCGRDSIPMPLRAYGEGKRQQEASLKRASGLNRRLIYRPSSVYGISRSQRIGLVTALIGNAALGRTTRIFGNMNTLRDYVFADDIGQYMARMILSGGRSEEVETLLLANGRSASVSEVISHIRERMGRPLLLQFDPHPTNVRNMSFLPSALPADWRPTSLGSGIARIVTAVRNSPA